MHAQKQSTPENTQGAAASGTGTESAWIMKAISDLREDMVARSDKLDEAVKGVNATASSLDTRLATIEGRLSKLLWVTLGVGGTLTLLWGGYELLTTFFDIDLSITTKED